MILTVVIAMPMPLWQGLAHRRMLKLAELFLCRVQLRMGLALAIAIVRLPAHLCKHFSAHCGKKQNLQCSLKICDISRKWCRPQSQCKLFHHCFTKTEHPGRTVLIGNVSLMLCLFMYLYKIIKKGETLPSQSENDPAMIENWKMAPAGRDAKSGRRGRYICAILFSWC